MFPIFFMAAFAGTTAWQVETARDPLGQAVYVASVAPDDARPQIALRFVCGGIAGVVFQFNTGDMRIAGLLAEPAPEDVRFEFAHSGYETTAKRAAIVDGIGTFEIKGTEAFHVANLMQGSGGVTVTRGRFSLTFPLDGAAAAIGEVMSQCPFKYRE